MQQGNYPIGDRVLAPTDTVTGVVTGTTADIPLSALGAYISTLLSTVGITGGTIANVTITNSPISGSFGSFTTISGAGTGLTGTAAGLNIGGTAASAINVTGGAANQILVQTGVGVTGIITAPITAGTVLGWNGTTFAWVFAPAATSANNLAGGAIDKIPFQTGVGATSFIDAPTTAATVLTWSGTAFTWAAAAGGGAGRLLASTTYSCLTQTVTFSPTASTVAFATKTPLTNAPIVFSTTGTLPSGIATGTPYFLLAGGQFSLTVGGSPVTWTGAGTGTHTVTNAPYDKTVRNASLIRVTLVGGGGAGGGAGNSTLVGGGGGAGGTSNQLIATSTFTGLQAITIGAGGVGAAGLVGGNGGTSSVGGTLSVATGGSGGQPASLVPIVTGGMGGTGFIGFGAFSICINSHAANGSPGFLIGTTYLGGIGGLGFLGGQAGALINTTTTPSAGAAPQGDFTGGGGGGAIGAGNATANVAGGIGTNGVCIIDEYS